MLAVYDPIMEELLEVQERIKKYQVIGIGDLKNFVHLEKYTRMICPVLVLFSSRIYGRLTKKTISLAVAFQFMDQALLVHRDLREDSHEAAGFDTDPKNGCQYPVLVGDYLYGGFFSTLCEEKITQYMEPLSEIICMINEGSVMRLKNQTGGIINPAFRQEIIRLETAELLAGCCWIAGAEAGADAGQQQHLSDFGRAMGMALGMAESGWHEPVAKYFKAALRHLEGLSPGEEREDLKEMVQFLLKRFVEDKKMVC